MRLNHPSASRHPQWRPRSAREVARRRIGPPHEVLDLGTSSRSSRSSSNFSMRVSRVSRWLGDPLLRLAQRRSLQHLLERDKGCDRAQVNGGILPSGGRYRLTQE